MKDRNRMHLNFLTNVGYFYFAAASGWAETVNGVRIIFCHPFSLLKASHPSFLATLNSFLFSGSHVCCWETTLSSLSTPPIYCLFYSPSLALNTFLFGIPSLSSNLLPNLLSNLPSILSPPRSVSSAS